MFETFLVCFCPGQQNLNCDSCHANMPRTEMYSWRGSKIRRQRVNGGTTGENDQKKIWRHVGEIAAGKPAREREREHERERTRRKQWGRKREAVLCTQGEMVLCTGVCVQERERERERGGEGGCSASPQKEGKNCYERQEKRKKKTKNKKKTMAFQKSNLRVCDIAFTHLTLQPEEMPNGSTLVGLYVSRVSCEWDDVCVHTEVTGWLSVSGLIPSGWANSFTADLTTWVCDQSESCYQLFTLRIPWSQQKDRNAWSIVLTWRCQRLYKTPTGGSRFIQTTKTE